jgi:hypothetical protein
MSFLDFAEDVYDELKCSATLPHLDPALKLAAAQLEFLKPAVCAPTAAGVWMGPVASVNRGTLLVVVADSKKVVTYHAIPPASMTTMVEGLVSTLEAQLTGADAGSKVAALRTVVRKFGGKPAEKSPPIDTELCGVQLAVVFSLMPQEQRLEFADWADRCRDADVCPALVVLIGPGSSGRRGKHSLAIATLPLAQYASVIPE